MPKEFIMQKVLTKKIIGFSFLPFVMLVFLIASIFGFSKGGLLNVAAVDDNPISVLLVDVDDDINDDYTPGIDDQDIILNLDTAQKITYDGKTIPVVLLDNTYEELAGDYIINKSSGIATSVTYNGSTYNLTDNRTTINGVEYFWDSNADEILRYEGSHQALFIQLGNESSYYSISSITLTINGQQLKVNDRIGDTSSSYNYFQQLLHGLSSSFVDSANFSEQFKTYLDSSLGGTALEAIEGLYQITIRYRYQGGLEQTSTISFYLITTTTYANEEERVQFDNTQKVTPTENSSAYALEHYFNQTNVNTTTSTGESVSSDKLEFPTLRYNPEKYLVSYQRALYSHVENGEFTFSVNSDQMTGTLTHTITRNRVVTSTETKTFSRQTDELAGEYTINMSNGIFSSVTYNDQDYTSDTNGIITIDGTQYYYDATDETIKVYDTTAIFLVEWTFEGLGNYEFYKTALIKTDSGYYEATNITLDDQSIIQTEALYMNGFQATYSTGGTGTAYLRNDEYNSDFTFLNNATINSYGTTPVISKPDASTVSFADNTLSIGEASLVIDNSIASTNQPTVKLEYNASLNTTTSTSWYIFINSQNQITVGDYRYSTTFYDAGLYFVYVSFVNNSNSATTTYTQQFIAFRITNIPPEISIITTDQNHGSYLVDSDGRVLEEENSKVIDVDDYTNQNVILSWAQPGPFDANIYATYTKTDYAANTEIVNATATGFVKYIQDDLEYANNDATIFSDNGIYNVRIYYTNSQNSSVALSFIIDKTDISGIMALEANTSTRQLANIGGDNSFESNVLSELTETGFNLVVNSPFVWTWDEKASGAEITAKFYYSSISTLSSFETGLIENSSNEEWLLANGQFSLLTAARDYNYTQVTEDNFRAVQFASSQILSSTRLCILLLEDAAGNTAVFITIYDDITPEFLQQEYNDGQLGNHTDSTMISKTTKLTWGSHKALAIQNATDSSRIGVPNLITDANTSSTWTFDNTTYELSNILTTSLNAYFKTGSDSNLYYTQSIKNSTISLNGQNHVFAPNISTTSEYTNTSIFVVIDEEDGNYYTYLSTSATGNPYNNMEKLLVSDGTNMTPYVMTINIFDNLDNQKQRTKQISLDQSQGSIFTHSGVVDNSGISNTTDEDMATANRQQIFGYNSTNRDYVTFSFLQQNSGIFQVESLTLDFYALVYDETLENYPYSDTALSSTIFSSQSSSVSWNILEIDENTYYHSYALQLSGSGQSQAGMYVVTRKYVDAFDSASSDETQGDVNSLTYTFFVDRNGVIYLNSANEYITGEDIALNLGLESYGDSYEETIKIFKDFSQQTVSSNEFANSFKTDERDYYSISAPSSYAISSNILPTNIALDLIDGIAYKYKTKVSDDEGNESYIYNSTNKNMTLMAIVQYFNNTGTFVNQKLYTSAVSRDDTSTNIYQISSLTGAEFNDIGTYRVMLMDTSNLTANLSGTWTDLELWEYSTFIPNYTIFSFEVQSISPSASAVTHSSSATNPYTTLSTSYRVFSGQTDAIYLTNSNDVIYHFSDSTDEYRAKIAYNDVTLTQTIYYLNSVGAMVTQNSTAIVLSNVRTWDSSATSAEEMAEIFSETEIARINGTYTGTITSLTQSTKEQDGGILYYRELISGTTDRYNYYIILPAVGLVNNLPADCTYALSYHYLGDRSDYQQTTYNMDGTVAVSYASYENTTRTYVDHTAPYQNLLALINDDTYLTSAQKAEMIANLNNPDYEFLQEYAFAVGPNFRLTDISDTENSSVFYYKKYNEDKYDDDIPQTSVPGSQNYENNINRFSESNFSQCYYSTFPTESGYYDIVEVDRAGNYRVYTIYLNSSAAQIAATGTDATTTDTISNIYSFSASFSSDNEPTYLVQERDSNSSIWSTIYSATGSITLTEATISAYSFLINSINIQDRWYTIRYRIHNGNDSSEWNTITITPDSDTSEIISTLNSFIESGIALGQESINGCKMEFIFNNRAGNDLRFYLLTAGRTLTINDLSPALIGQSSFTIVMPADTYAMQYQNLSVRLNGTTVITRDANNKLIDDANTDRTQAHSFVFTYNSNARYTFQFSDNFGREYSFIYPSTEGLINEIVFEDGSTPQYYNGTQYTPNDTQFRYTSLLTERISITITDAETNTVLLDLQDLLYSNQNETEKVPKDLLTASEMYSQYFELEKVGTTVTLTFKALTNVNYVYNINFIDVDNNEYTHSFGIYTYAPTVSLTDTSGVAIWNSQSSDNVTSKTVVARWATDDSILFDPVVQVIYNETTTTIDSPYMMSAEGTYVIQIVSSLGIINDLTVTFTIRPATDSVYSVYFEDQLLTAHTAYYQYTVNGETINIKHYFFLSNATDPWSSVHILPDEDKDLEYKVVGDPGNTRIYRIYSNIYESYFAVTQIRGSNNNLTTFSIHTYTDTTDPTSSSVINASAYSLTLMPDANNNATYAQLRWNTAYTDNTNGAVYQDFVYLYIIYNDTVPMGTFTSGTVNLTKSGKYTIQIYDIVGQVHRFGSTVATTSFTLTLLNDVLFYVNNESPIENATYNDSVIVSLTDLSNYAWSQTGQISVLRNNVVYTNFEQAGTSRVGTSWTFTEAGHYTIELSTQTATTNPVTITGRISFTIVDQNESKLVYDFARISGYSVESVQRISYDADTDTTTYVDVTEQLKNIYQVETLQNFSISPETLGNGKYLITINIREQELIPEQSYSFIVWINNEIPTLQSSRDFGTSAKGSVTISYNASILYEQVGNCYIAVNGTPVEGGTIDSSREDENSISTFPLEDPGTYFVQIFSKSGTLLSSQRITIEEPLNTASIILIIVGCVVFVGIVVTFIILRTRMKVK